MITKFYGKSVPLKFLKEISFQTREGVSLLGLTQAAEKLGYEKIAAKLSYAELRKHTDKLPLIVHWNENHFVVLYKVRKNLFTGKLVFHVADPSHGHVRLSEERFLESWLKSKEKGVCLLLFPGENFEAMTAPKEPTVGVATFFKYVRSFRKELLLLALGMLVISLVTLIFPFLTQLLIDEGIQPKRMSVVATILIAQIVLFLGVLTTEVIRNMVLLYLGTRINISIISEFLKKLLQLPLHFFDTKQMGDINQRIQDHDRIESFLTSHSLLTLFSLINFSVFFIVLLQYNVWIVTIYFLLTLLAIVWSLAFLERRKQLDYQKFLRRSENQDVVFELVNGIEEIKLNGFETYNRNKWEHIQFHLFKVNMRVLRVDQVQRVGFDLINQVKNIVVTFVAAREVVLDHISLGALLAISYIIGQMNSPVNQIIQFFLGYQDAKISLERLLEVELHHDEEHGKSDEWPLASTENAIEVEVRDLSFQYEGPESPFVLKDINLTIQRGKITAIVGESGSGKTTLMRLLLAYYAPTGGEILVNGHTLETLSPKRWRAQCGTVLQDGYLFSDTIERNIAMGKEEIDQDRLDYSLKMACLHEFVHALPLGLKTKVGPAGIGLSGGQKQRLFIARAIYKDPHFILFDEATSALDAKTEKSIQENLNQFLSGRTAVVIAHRLSTVKNADQIIVIDQGEIVERGTHESLTARKGIYYNLVKNQLNLGN